MSIKSRWLLLGLAWLLAQGPVSALASQDGGEVRLVVLGDRTNRADQQAFQTVLEDVNRLQPDLVVTVGDLIQGYKPPAGTAADWDSLLPCLEVLDCPVYLTPGNHDITTPEVRDLFVKKTGRQPYYSFNFRNHHFVVLDNSLASSPDKMDPAQLKWLEKDLAAARASAGVLVFMHRPFWPFGIGAGKSDRMHDLFKKHKVKAVFAGHWHRYASEVYDGIRYVVMGSSGAELRQGLTENLSLANFHQFMWVTARKGKLSMALVKAGSTFGPGHVSLQEETFAYQMPDKAMTLKGPPVTEGKTPKLLEVELSLANLTEKTIRGDVTWETAVNWQPVSQRTSLEIAPRDTLKAMFKFKGTGIFYPLPTIRFAYPFGRDKVFNIEGYAPDIVKVVECPRAKKAPVPDGQLTPGEWLGAAKVQEFCDFEGQPAQADPTEVYFLHDGEFLYIAAICHDRSMGVLRAATTTRDGRVTDEDCIGLMFASHQDTVYQVYLNPLGAIWDRLIDNLKQGHDDRWNGRFEAQGGRNEQEWFLEIKVPWKDVGLSRAAQGAELRMNIRRHQQRNDRNAIWVPGWSHDPGYFGIIRCK